MLQIVKENDIKKSFTVTLIISVDTQLKGDRVISD